MEDVYDVGSNSDLDPTFTVDKFNFSDESSIGELFDNIWKFWKQLYHFEEQNKAPSMTMLLEKKSQSEEL